MRKTLAVAIQILHKDTGATVKYLIVIFMLVGLCACTKKQAHGTKKIHLHSRQPVRSLDPVLAHDTFTQRMVLQIYEGLLHFHYLKRPLQLEPLLAESMPTISQDGKVLTFKIKKGIYFQDDPAFKNGEGREIEAKDFIYSWKRLADPENKSENYWVFRDKILGLDEWREAKGQKIADYATPIAGLQAVGKYTLRIELKKTNYQILYLLATAATVVVAQEVVEHYGSEFFTRAVGTGAYALKEWVRNSKIVLEKNKKYRNVEYPSEGETEDKAQKLLESAGQELPFIDTIVVYEVAEEQPPWLLFQKRELDIWQVPKDYQQQVMVNGQLAERFLKKQITITKIINPDTTYVGFNTENIFLKNKKIRQAMAMAYNQDMVLKKFFNVFAVPAHGPITPKFDGYRQDLKNPYLIYNLEKAQQLLSEAGFPKGKGLPSFKFEISSTSTTARQMAEFFKEQMSQIGIHIQLQPNTWPQFSEKLKNKKADLFEMAWNADYPDAENFLQLFYGKNVSPGSNSANYNNPEFDILFEKALSLPPSLERTRLYEKMEEIVIEDMPWIFNFHRTLIFVKQPWVKNHKHDQMVMDVFKYYDIDTELQSKLSKDTL